jgi:acyl carrier protein
MQRLDEVRNVFSDVLSLGERGKSLTEESTLLGSIPELDSMAVINVLTALEEYFGVAFDDDEISASTFETLRGLTDFVNRKLAE